MNRPSERTLRKSYSDKLRDPRWQKKRLKVMERDGFACRTCGDTKTTLNVHHAYYERGREPWEYEDDELKTLCETCHGVEYRMREEVEQQLVRAVRKRISLSNAYELGLWFEHHFQEHRGLDAEEDFFTVLENLFGDPARVRTLAREIRSTWGSARPARDLEGDPA